MLKRLESIVISRPADNSSDYSYSHQSGPNWDLINSTIKEQHPNDSWYVPAETRYNAWTCLVHSTLGNIGLRDFALERKFSDMRHERVQEYKRKWEEARDKGDKEYLAAHICFGLDNSFWDNWTQEEIEYYSNVDRFPILKTQSEQGQYPLWDKRNPMYEATENMRLYLNKVNNRR